MAKLFLLREDKPININFPDEREIGIGLSMKECVDILFKIGKSKALASYPFRKIGFCVNADIGDVVPVMKYYMLDVDDSVLYITSYLENTQDCIFVDILACLKQYKFENGMPVFLGHLDGFTLQEVDPYMLGSIAVESASWSVMEAGLLSAFDDSEIYLIGSEYHIVHDITQTNAESYIESIGAAIEISDISSEWYRTLGEIDGWGLENADTERIDMRVLNKLSPIIEVVE